MKTLGSIAMAVAAIGIALFVLLVIPADQRGEDACREASGTQTSATARDACADHERRSTPMRVAGMAVFLTFVAGMVMYKRGRTASS